ncbi:hypothetical protein K470DRAFT_219422, partial [Piedraia hortae CBS 480.64]
PQNEYIRSLIAVAHMFTYWTLLSTIPASTLRLTKNDQLIYSSFLAMFPEYTPSEGLISENFLKDVYARIMWGAFGERVGGLVSKPGEKVLLRLDPKREYHIDNVTLVSKLQFCAVEGARCKAGLNEWVFRWVGKTRWKRGKGVNIDVGGE